MTFGLLAQLGGKPWTLVPRGAAASSIATLTWWTIWISAAIGVLVLVLMIVPLLRRRAPEPGEPEDPLSAMPSTSREVSAAAWIGGGGIAMTGIILLGVFLATLLTMRRLDASGRAASLDIDVVGHRWWWEIRYPGRGVVTANEIHIPVGTRVRVSLASLDVIHSFWVPQLAGKTDLIPGQHNTTWIEADSAGRYEGLCAEYCGPQHAHMDFVVVAEPPDSFAQWLAREAGPAAVPTDPVAARGQQVLLGSQCPACHTIRGTAAAGTVGPDLTHLGSRATIAAGALANTPGNLGGWIDDAPGIKPGTLMPPMPLSGADLRAVIGYLESLR